MTDSPRYTIRTWNRVALWAIVDRESNSVEVLQTFPTQAEAQSAADALNSLVAEKAEDHAAHQHVNSYDEETCEALGSRIKGYDATGCPITDPADFTDEELFGTAMDTDENNAMRASDTSQACHHPLSCPACQRANGPCGGHNVGDREHRRCTGVPSNATEQTGIEMLQELLSFDEEPDTFVHIDGHGNQTTRSAADGSTPDTVEVFGKQIPRREAEKMGAVIEPRFVARRQFCSSQWMVVDTQTDDTATCQTQAVAERIAERLNGVTR